MPFGIGSVRGAPTSVLANPFEMPSARSGASVRMGVDVARWRPSQPVTTVVSAGLPTSMKRCASKCEREGLVDPVAWTTRR